MSIITPEIHGEFKPISAITKWVQLVFFTMALLCLVAVISGFAQAQFLNATINGEVISDAQAAANDARQAVIGIIQYLLIVVSGISFLVWIHRACKNLYSLGLTTLRFTPGWAVGWFFVPIMAFFRPYQVVSEIWKASDPKIETRNGTTLAYAKASPIIGWWWFLYLMSGFVDEFAGRLLLRGETPSDFLNATYLKIVSDTLDIVGIVVTILLVTKINELQNAKHKLIHQGGLTHGQQGQA